MSNTRWVGKTGGSLKASRLVEARSEAVRRCQTEQSTRAHKRGKKREQATSGLALGGLAERGAKGTEGRIREPTTQP